MTADDTKSFTITLADPCAGVTCPNKCTGYDLYSQKCANGACVNDALIEHNSATCGYVAPSSAKGDITGVDYPVAIPKGKVKFNVTADYKNVGGSSGTFYLQIGLWTGTHWWDPHLLRSPQFILAAGATGTQAFTALQSPEIGSPLTELKFRVRMFQIT